MSDDLNLALRIHADMRDAIQNLDRLERELGATGTAARRAGRQAAGAAGGIDRAGRAARRATGPFRDAAGQINIVGYAFSSAFGNVGAAVTLRAGKAVADLTRGVVDAGLDAERLEARFRSATGSAAAGAREFQFLRAEADRLGIDLTAAADAYSGFAATTRGTALEGEATRQVFTAVAEASRAMGLSANQTGGALLALQQIASRGKVSAEELTSQFGGHLPGAFQIAAKALGVTTTELDRMLAAGELMADKFLPRFATTLREHVADGVADATEDAASSFARLGNAVGDLQREIADSIVLDWLGSVADALRGLIGLVTTTPAESAESAASRIAGLASDESDPKAQAKLVAAARVDRAGVQSLFERARTAEQKRRNDIAQLRRDLERVEADPNAAPGEADTLRFAIAAIEEELRSLTRHADALRRGLQQAAIQADREMQKRIAPDYPGALEAAPRSNALVEIEARHREMVARRDETEREALDRWLRERLDAIDERAETELASTTQVEATKAAVRADYAQRVAAIDVRQAKKRERADAEAAQDAERLAQDRASVMARIYERQADLGLVSGFDAAKRFADETIIALGAVDIATAGNIAQVRAIERAWVERATAEANQVAQAAEEAAREAAERQLRESRDASDGAVRALRDIADEAGDTAAHVESALSGAFRSMEDALVGFIQRGKLDFSSLADHIVTELARIAVRQSIIEPLAGALGGVFGGGGPGGLLSSLFGGGVPVPAAAGAGNVFHAVWHGGGVAGALGGVRRYGVPPALWADAPRFHRGGLAGRLRPRELPVIVEAGEEILPASHPRHRRNAGGAPEVSIQFVNRGTPQREVGRESRFDGRRWVVGIVLDDLDRGGPIRREVGRIAAPGGGAL